MKIKNTFKLEIVLFEEGGVSTHSVGNNLSLPDVSMVVTQLELTKQELLEELKRSQESLDKKN